jgi:hypothetical protein
MDLLMEIIFDLVGRRLAGAVGSRLPVSCGTLARATAWFMILLLVLFILSAGSLTDILTIGAVVFVAGAIIVHIERRSEPGNLDTDDIDDLDKPRYR